ncbi:hypothetical protein J4230_03935 [Candidatus Woesearchaeota archaeon]|nr:hypothetical protein [Candidatus Woesearchaeota archaeon]
MVLEGVSFNLADSINYLISLGIFDILLPFLLIFSIVFAILEKTKILGSDKKNINAIVAVVVGMLVIVQQGIVQTINLFLPRVSLIIVVILMGLLVISMIAGREFSGLKGGVLGFAIIVIIIAIILALTTPPTGYGSNWLTPTDVQILLSLGIPLLVLFIVIGLVTGGSKGNSQPKRNYLRELAEGFGGQGGGGQSE